MPAPVPSPLEALQKRLGYVFRNAGLLTDAITHPSYLQEHPEIRDNNQRLEFLGDAVLQLILTQNLFRVFPQEREGGLSKRRAALTNGVFLAQLAVEAGLDGCLLLGPSEEATGGRAKGSALEDAFEALVGALYLDSDLATVERIVMKIYGDLPERLAGVEDADNPKGRLQELIQPAHGNNALRYEVLGIAGADHERAYEVAVYLLEQPIGRGQGPSKKVAEEAAARAALDYLAETRS